MFKVGITGGIGSGKSTICKELCREYSIPIYYADDRAKSLMSSNKVLRDALVNLFGDKSFEDGVLNRQYISSIVFNDKEMLNTLNAIVHATVMNDFVLWVESQNSQYVVCEAAILIESGWYKTMDMIVMVTAPDDERIRRVMERDGSSFEQVESRILSQMNDSDRSRYVDMVISTDGSKSIELLSEELNDAIVTKSDKKAI